MRYSVVGMTEFDDLTLASLKLPPINGVDIIKAQHCKQVFITLTDHGVKELISRGYNVQPVSRVKTSVISAPKDIIGAYDSTPDDTFDLLGLSDFKLTVSPPLSGLGYCIAVIDSGIRSTHQLLGGSVVYSKNSIS